MRSDSSLRKRDEATSFGILRQGKFSVLRQVDSDVRSHRQHMRNTALVSLRPYMCNGLDLMILRTTQSYTCSTIPSAGIGDGISKGKIRWLGGLTQRYPWYESTKSDLAFDGRRRTTRTTAYLTAAIKASIAAATIDCGLRRARQRAGDRRGDPTPRRGRCDFCAFPIEQKVDRVELFVPVCSCGPYLHGAQKRERQRYAHGHVRWYIQHDKRLS